MTNSSSNPIQELGEAWAVIYPLIHWVIEHPIASLVLMLIGLYLLWGVLRGLIYLTERLWIRLLRSPLWLVQTLWNGRQLPSFLSRSNHEVSQHQACDRLRALIEQLEAAHQQQEQLLTLAKEELRKIDEL